MDEQSQGSEAEIAQRVSASESGAGEPETGSQEPQPESDSSEGVMPAPEQAEKSAEQDTQEEPSQSKAEQEEELSLGNEDVSERTKEQFEKLKQRNRELAQKVSKEEESEQAQETAQAPQQDVLDSIYNPGGEEGSTAHLTDAGNYANLDQQQVDSIASQYIQQDSKGNQQVDTQGLVNALMAANQQTVQQAQQSAQQVVQEYEHKQQVREAHNAHPELDPQNKSEFDPTFYKLVKAEMLDSLVQSDNRTLSDVASSVRKTMYDPKSNSGIENAQAQAVEQYKASQQQKAQAAPAQHGAGAGRENVETDLQDLRSRTQSEDVRVSEQAVIERLSRLE